MSDQQRNYDGTGAGTDAGSNRIYLRAPKDKEGYVKDKTDITRNHICGYLDGFSLRFDDGKPDDNINPGWKITLTISAKDPELGVEKDGIADIATYAIDIPMTNRSGVTKVLNVLSATDLNWAGTVKIGRYKKDNKVRFYFKTSWGEGHDPVSWPWDPQIKGNAGVPVAIEIPGAFDSNGNQIYDYTAKDNFHLKVAKQLHLRFSGSAAPNIPDVQPGGYARMGVTKASIAGEQPATAAPAPSSPATPATAPAAKALTYDERVEASLAKIVDIASANEWFQKANKQRPSDYTETKLVALFGGKLVMLGISATFRDGAFVLEDSDLPF